jgi:hypothetical protein
MIVPLRHAVPGHARDHLALDAAADPSHSAHFPLAQLPIHSNPTNFDPENAADPHSSASSSWSVGIHPSGNLAHGDPTEIDAHEPTPVPYLMQYLPGAQSQFSEHSEHVHFPPTSTQYGVSVPVQREWLGTVVPFLTVAEQAIGAAAVAAANIANIASAFIFFFDINFLL